MQKNTKSKAKQKDKAVGYGFSKKRKEIDPNNPFAALLELKNKL